MANFYKWYICAGVCLPYQWATVSNSGKVMRNKEQGRMWIRQNAQSFKVITRRITITNKTKPKKQQYQQTTHSSISLRRIQLASFVLKKTKTKIEYEEMVWYFVRLECSNQFFLKSNSISNKPPSIVGKQSIKKNQLWMKKRI